MTSELYHFNESKSEFDRVSKAFLQRRISKKHGEVIIKRAKRCVSKTMLDRYTLLLKIKNDFQILEIQINKLNNKKQEIERFYLEGMSNLNRIQLQTSLSIEVTKQINEGINRKIMTAPRFSPIFLNLIVP